MRERERFWREKTKTNSILGLRNIKVCHHLAFNKTNEKTFSWNLMNLFAYCTYTIFMVLITHKNVDKEAHGLESRKSIIFGLPAGKIEKGFSLSLSRFFLISEKKMRCKFTDKSLKNEYIFRAILFLFFLLISTNRKDFS